MKNIIYAFLLLSINISSAQNLCEFKLLASDGEDNDLFGRAVAIENDRMVVGATHVGVTGKSTGAIYIYDWNGTDWEETKLLASDGENYDRLGIGVDVRGDRVAAGAYWDVINDTTSSGSVYIFDLVDGVWEETKLVASDPDDTDLYGQFVELSDDRIVVSSHQDDDNGGDAGAFYIYDWNGTDWVETKIIASDGHALDIFGYGLSVDGDRIVAGAPADHLINDQCGSMYIYDWDGSNWVETKIWPSDPAVTRAFGISTDVQGDTIVVGAYLDTTNGQNAGAVYVYIWDGSTWVETKILASDGELNDYFGHPVRIQDDRILATAVGYHNFRGKVYIFDWDGTNWVETPLLASDGTSFKRFGTGLDLHADRIVSGAYHEADNGAVYEYGGPSGLKINTFTGSNSDWHDPANWSLNLVPTTCNHVIIPTGKNVEILNGQNGTCYKITTEDNATLELKSNATLNVMDPE